MGLLVLDTGNAKAASWNGPTMEPLVIHPKSPPWRALSSLYAAATSGNFWPDLIFSRASKHFDCFSQRMCLTLTAVPPFFSFPGSKI